MVDKIQKAEKHDPLIGQTLGEYRVKALVGIGGMARVYEAYDEKLDRQVAIKLMTTQHDDDEEAAQRFWREARALASLDHPRIVTLYHIGEYNLSYYISMKFIDGKTLLTTLKQLRQQKKFLEPERIVSIISDVAAALDYAHSKGVIHRDIKPSNIMLTNDDQAILTDFGLMMQTESVSTLGTAFGTPRYIAPEQAISSHRAVPQSDIYSLGVVLYETVTGKAPFDNDSPMSLALSHITNPPPPPRSIRPDIPGDVQVVILKALEKNPEDRFQTASEMANALRHAYGIDPGKSLAVAPRVIGPVARPLVAAPATLPLAENMEVTPSLVLEAEVISSDRRRRWVPLLMVAAVALILLAGIGVRQFLNSASWAPLASNASLSTATPIPPRVRLFYSKDWFAIYNPTGKPVSLHGVTFVRGDGSTGAPFDPKNYLGEAAVNRLGDGQCLRIRLDKADDSSAPSVCGPQNRVGLINDPNARFWLPLSDEDAIFVVKRDQSVLQTCQLWLNTCEVYLP